MEAISRRALMGRNERIDAERARRLGIVGEVVEPEDLRGRAQEIGDAIAEGDPAMLAAAKAAAWAALERP